MTLMERFAHRHPSVTGVLRFLEFDHLRDARVRDLSSGFATLAASLMDHLPDDPELTVALESKDLRDQVEAE